MEETNHPPHEALKREIINKFTANTTYIGAHIKKTIQETDFKILKQNAYPPEYIKKGDVIVLAQGAKTRPCVIVKVLKDRTCIYIPLTSTDNIHCLVEFNSRFLRNGCFCRSMGVCTEEKAIQSYIGVFDNMKALNLAIKELKEFINRNI